MKHPLPNSVSSLQDLAALEVDIKEYAKWFTHNEIKSRLHAKKGSPPPIVSNGALEMIRTVSSGTLLTHKHLDSLLTDIATFRKQAESLTITLAAPASGEMKKTLVSWCREHISHNILVSFSFNSTLCGGMVIRYGSHVYDWSFRRTILNERGRFTEVLRRV